MDFGVAEDFGVTEDFGESVEQDPTADKVFQKIRCFKYKNTTSLSFPCYIYIYLYASHILICTFVRLTSHESVQKKPHTYINNLELLLLLAAVVLGTATSSGGTYGS